MIYPSELEIKDRKRIPENVRKTAIIGVIVSMLVCYLMCIDGKVVTHSRNITSCNQRISINFELMF